MKTNFTSLCKVLACASAFTLISLFTSAQCIAPAMVWQHPVLVSGAANQVNAQYKFANVTSGVDAFVTITGTTGGATLTNIDDSTMGYNGAWQPIVKTPTTMGASTSYMSFKVDFKNTDGSSHSFNCFQLSFIDVDGDGAHVREMVAAKNSNAVTVGPLSVLTVQSTSGNFVQATAPYTNFPNIDTSAWKTNINFGYANSNSVNEIRIGCITDNNFTVQERYACGFFQQITMPTIPILPVNYVSFDANAIDKNVILKWTTENEINNNHFEVERSFDGTHFSTVGLVLDGFANGTQKNYMFKDNGKELLANNTVYYRLKQVDNNDKFTYTNTLVVKLGAIAETKMQVSPNPFVETLTAGFIANTSGIAEMKIVSITGQVVCAKQVSVSKGYNSVQVGGLAKLAPGMYVARLTLDNAEVSTQKIIKN
ncbi:MAG: T9SS type A sorting domain-containing protein [Bacteroidetes bacterium]|nr:T9SS type A sorting domain-containing protein [Bacteroidota bacterium]